MENKQILQFNVFFKTEPEGGFTTLVPSLPGCVSYGKNLKEARQMTIDAIEGYVISLKKHNEPIPSDENTFLSLIQLPAQKSPIYA